MIKKNYGGKTGRGEFDSSSDSSSDSDSTHAPASRADACSMNQSIRKPLSLPPSPQAATCLPGEGDVESLSQEHEQLAADTSCDDDLERVQLESLSTSSKQRTRGNRRNGDQPGPNPLESLG